MAFGGNGTQAWHGATGSADSTVPTWVPGIPGGLSPGSALLLCPNTSASSEWLWHVLGECPVGRRDYVSVAFALLSIVCFLLATLPQLYESYRTGKADQALSIWFLLSWLGGDCSNLIGCILTNQQHLQTLMAVDYVMMDNLVMSQYFYYRVRNRSGGGSCLQWVCVCWMLACTLIAFLLPSALFWRHPMLMPPILGTNSSLDVAHASKQLPPMGWMELVGYTCSSASAAFYLGGRLPQLYRNYKRRSVEGVSLALFMLIMLGNSTYGTSVVLKAPRRGETEGQALFAHLPWLIGSFGTLLLDLSMVTQFVRYRRHDGRPGGTEPIQLRLDEREGAPLLMGWGDE